MILWRMSVDGCLFLLFLFFLEAERRARLAFYGKRNNGGYTPDHMNQTMHFMAQLGMEAAKGNELLSS